MTISEYTEQLQEQLKAEVARLNKEHPDRLAFLARIVPYTSDLIAELQQFTHTYIFSGPDEEIHFFKESKPVLLSQYFFYKKALSIFLYDSYKNDIESKKVYYQSALARLEDFQRKNSSFHLYCITGLTHLDGIYFLRSIVQYQGLIDPKFSTGYDIKLAKLLANELLRSEVKLMIEQSSMGDWKLPRLRWTASKTDLVELIYGLHAAGVFNNATSDVRTIVDTFERLFDIGLGNYYRTFLGIRIRKTGQTAFLDHLKNRLVQRMNDIDGK